MEATPDTLQLTRRLSSDPPDPTALSELFMLCYEPLIARLKKQYLTTDEDEIREIAFQSIERFAEAPQKFDPQKKTLLGYLVMDAAGDLKNSLNRKGYKKNWTVLVEDWTSHGNRTIEETSNPEMETEAIEQYLSKLRELTLDHTDFIIAKMMEMGVRSTEEFAKALKIEHLSREEQRSVVKRHKDRIGKHLQRKGWESIKQQIREQYL
ncbi:MAG: hypothetical protein J5I98_17370 [Phaeodactylibacter sp.]|nr:hypothetical protein [Phaeodactylibacter sp.]